MRLLAMTATYAGMMIAVPYAFSQQLPAPQAPKQSAGRGNAPDVSRLTPGVNGVPGSMVYLPPYYRNGPYYYNGPGPVYYGNRFYPYGYSSPYPYSGQFYAFMGGVAPSNPFMTNSNPYGPTWANAPGISPTGQPWNVPFGYSNLNGFQQPFMGNGPFMNQPNGFFPTQQPPVIQPPVQQNNFGVQNVPGVNGFGNPPVNQ